MSRLIASYVITGLWGLLPWFRASTVSTCLGRSSVSPQALPNMTPDLSLMLCLPPRPGSHLAGTAACQCLGHRLEVAVATKEPVEQDEGWPIPATFHFHVGQGHCTAGRQEWGMARGAGGK